jgi:phage gpG-like protein
MKFHTTVEGVPQLTAKFSALREGITDFRGVTWTRVRNAFFKVEKEIFANEGGASKWKDLSSPYKELKQKKYGNQPILQASGRFYKSLTSRSGDAVMEETETELTLGSRTPYGGFHHTGTSKMPRRDPLDFTEAHKKEITEPIALRVRQLIDNLKLRSLR